MKRFTAKDSVEFNYSAFVTDSKFNYAIDYFKEISKRLNGMIAKRSFYGEVFYRAGEANDDVIITPESKTNSTLRMYGYVYEDELEIFEGKTNKEKAKSMLQKAIEGLDVKLSFERTFKVSGSGKQTSKTDFQFGWVEAEDDPEHLIDFTIILPGDIPWAKGKEEDVMVNLTSYYFDSKKGLKNKKMKDEEIILTGDELAKKVATAMNRAGIKSGPFAENRIEAIDGKIHVESQLGEETVEFFDDDSVHMKWDWLEGGGEDGEDIDAGEMDFDSFEEFANYAYDNELAWFGEIDLRKIIENPGVGAEEIKYDLKRILEPSILKLAKKGVTKSELIEAIEEIIGERSDIKDACKDDMTEFWKKVKKVYFDNEAKQEALEKAIDYLYNGMDPMKIKHEGLKEKEFIEVINKAKELLKSKKDSKEICPKCGKEKTTCMKDEETAKEVLSRICNLMGKAHDLVMEAQDSCSDLNNYYDVDASYLSDSLDDAEASLSDFDTAGDIETFASNYDIQIEGLESKEIDFGEDEDLEDLDIDEEDL